MSKLDGWQRVFQAEGTASTSEWRSSRCNRCEALQIAQCNESEGRVLAGIRAKDGEKGRAAREGLGCHAKDWTLP